MTFEHRINLGGKDSGPAIAAIEAHGAGLIRIRPFLLDVSVEQRGDWLHVFMRLTDIERSRILVNARKAILAMAAKARLDPRGVQLRQALIEPNARSFVVGQGRAPMARRPRSREPQSVEGS